MGARSTEWSETFQRGVNRIDGGTCILLSMRTRKNGVEHAQMADPCDWSLGDMLKQIVEWDADTTEAVASTADFVVPGNPILDALSGLAHGPRETVTIGTCTWALVMSGGTPTLVPQEGCDPKWTLDETVERARKGR